MRAPGRSASATNANITATPVDNDALHFPAADLLDKSAATRDLTYNAKRATEKEHNMTLWQGIKLYPKAVAWSVLISTCIAMGTWSPARTVVRGRTPQKRELTSTRGI
jgi:hypothetical protein